MPPATPFTDQLTVWFELPVTVAVNCCVCPVVRLAVPGETDTSSKTCKFTAAVVPPPGLGVVTVIGIAPALASRVAGTVAVSCVELTNEVARAVAPACTSDCFANPVPVTVRVESGLPAFTVEGEIELIAGVGFVMATDAEAVRVRSAALVAFTVTVFGEGGTAGAV